MGIMKMISWAVKIPIVQAKPLLNYLLVLAFILMIYIPKCVQLELEM